MSKRQDVLSQKEEENLPHNALIFEGDDKENQNPYLGFIRTSKRLQQNEESFCLKIVDRELD